MTMTETDYVLDEYRAEPDLCPKCEEAFTDEFDLYLARESDTWAYVCPVCGHSELEE